LGSFKGVYDRLAVEPRLVLHAAARLNPQRIVVDEIRHELIVGAGWDGKEATRHLDTCRDLQLLQGDTDLRMHQLFARFVRENLPSADIGGPLKSVVRAQTRRMVELAEMVGAAPNRSDLVSLLTVYTADQQRGTPFDDEFLFAEALVIGRALLESGQFTLARPWCERAVVQAEQGDVYGRVDHASLGLSLHCVGRCLSSTGEFAAARPWYERAVTQAEQGDVHGRVDHASLGLSLHEVGHSLSSIGEFAAARPWYERAVAEKERGDMHGRVDHESLGVSLHEVGQSLSSTGEFAAARPW
jgi:hypothetical protein